MTTATVTTDPQSVPVRPSAVSVGFFDGVHRGHQAIIARAQWHAAERGLRSVVVTFDRHPMEITRPADSPPLLMTADRRAATLAGLGVDLVVVLTFDERLREQPPDDFIAQVLRSSLDARHVVVGDNFRFGHGAAGDVDLLRRVGAREGFAVDGVPLLHVDGAPVSSTRIRRALAEGDVVTAGRLSGRPFVVDGTVVAGDRRGRDLGYPTANLAYDPRCVVPAPGIYAGLFSHPDGRRLPAVTSVGTNPTFDGTELRVESYVLDFDGDLYGLDVSVDFRHRVRGQERFAGVDELIAAMDRDTAETRDVLSAVDRVPGGPGAGGG